MPVKRCRLRLIGWLCLVKDHELSGPRIVSDAAGGRVLDLYRSIERGLPIRGLIADPTCRVSMLWTSLVVAVGPAVVDKYSRVTIGGDVEGVVALDGEVVGGGGVDC